MSTPSHPPRRRPTGIRRPRVAGRAPSRSGRETGGVDLFTPVIEPVPDEVDAEELDAEGPGVDESGAGEPGAGGQGAEGPGAGEPGTKGPGGLAATGLADDPADRGVDVGPGLAAGRTERGVDLRSGLADDPTDRGVDLRPRLAAGRTERGVDLRPGFADDPTDRGVDPGSGLADDPTNGGVSLRPGLADDSTDRGVALPPAVAAGDDGPTDRRVRLPRVTASAHDDPADHGAVPSPGAAPAGGDPADRPTGKRARPARPTPGIGRSSWRMPTWALGVVAVVLVAAAVVFGVEAAQLRGSASARNTALVDVGATAQVSQQVSDALTKIYSFDYTRLDQNEAAARAVITPAFDAQFSTLFTQVRQLAPAQKAVVTATVTMSGVRSIDGDTAQVLVFLDQQATRAADGGQPQQLAAAGRLSVTAQDVDGVWKIAGVTPQ